MTDVLTSKGNTSRYSGQGQDECPYGQSCPLYRLVLGVAYQKSVQTILQRLRKNQGLIGQVRNLFRLQICDINLPTLTLYRMNNH